MAETCEPPSETKSYTRASYFGNSEFADHPVIYVSWEDARTYCDWRGARLPTEAEWEKAARSTDGRRYPWGDEHPTCDHAVFNINDVQFATGNCGAGSQPVGTRPAGASMYGINDRAGNVYEWVADWYDGGYYYMAPEAEVGTFSPASDLFSLGVCVYEALTGRLPFPGPNFIVQKREMMLVPPRQLVAGTSRALDRALQRALHADPARRYADAGALATDLNRYLADRPLLGVRNRNVLERWRKWARRSPSKLARLGLLGGLLIALLMGVNQVRGVNDQRRRAAEQALEAAQEQTRRQQHAAPGEARPQAARFARRAWRRNEP